MLPNPEKLFGLSISTKDDNGVATGIEDVNNTNTFKLLSVPSGYTLYNTNGINGTVQVIDMTGKVIWTKTNVSSTSVSIDLDQVSSGIYFIHVMSKNQRVYSNKVVK